MATLGICPVFGSVTSSIDADDGDEDLALDGEEEVGISMGFNPATRSSAVSVNKLEGFEKVLMKIYYDVEMAPSPTRVLLSKRLSPLKKSSTVQNNKLQSIDEDSLADRFDALELNYNPDIPQNRARSTSGDSVMTNTTSASGSSSGRFQNRPLPKTPAVITSVLPNIDLHRHTTSATSHPSLPPLIDETDSSSKRISNETAATEDSPSIAPESTILADIQPLTSVEFQDFFKRLWRGTSVNVVYSMNPLVEKTRLLFLRSDAATNNDLLVDRIKNHRANPLLEWIQRRINQGVMVPLFLGWAHRSEAGNLMHDVTKSLSMQTIINVKIGSKKYENCIKITGHTKVIVIKIDGDEAKLQLIVRGLTQLAILVSPTFQKLA
jgi:hypothetical protein